MAKLAANDADIQEKGIAEIRAEKHAQWAKEQAQKINKAKEEAQSTNKSGNNNINVSHCGFDAKNGALAFVGNPHVTNNQHNAPVMNNKAKEEPQRINKAKEEPQRINKAKEEPQRINKAEEEAERTNKSGKNNITISHCGFDAKKGALAFVGNPHVINEEYNAHVMNNSGQFNGDGNGSVFDGGFTSSKNYY